MIKNNLKRYVIKGAALSGAYKFVKKFKKGATVLFYHGVVDNIINSVVQETHLPLAAFEKQIRYLKKNFEVISLDYLYECISKGYKFDPSQIVLTFDDGYKNNFHIVAPLLRTFSMPFTVFVSTRHIDHSDGLRLPYYYVQAAIFYTEQKSMDVPSIKKSFDISNQQMRISVINKVLETIKIIPQKLVSQIVEDIIRLLPDDRWLELNSLYSSDEMMSWDEVRKLHDSGVRIGSHCHDHAILHSKQSEDEIDYQLRTSKDLIEKYLGECRYFAYPNGRMSDISSHALMSVKKSKYLLGFTTVSGEIVKDKFNPLLLPRIYPRREMDSFEFALNTSFCKNYDYYKQLSIKDI